MKPHILTLERLQLIYRAIAKSGGEKSFRQLTRNNGVWWWEIEQAAEAGYVTLHERQPRVGRPSTIVKNVSKNYPTKLPPRSHWVEDCIPFKHWRFAFHYALGEFGPGFFDFRRRAYVAYMKVYPNAKSRAGARASASRLLRLPHMRAAIEWTFAKWIEREPACQKLHPETATEVWDALRVAGSWRVRRAPWWIKRQWSEQEDNEA